MAKYKFGDLRAWTRKVGQRATHVVQRSTHDVFEDAQTPQDKGGRMPVKTGRLRNSLSVRLGGGLKLKGATSYQAVAAAMQPGDVVAGGWWTGYERAAEYGDSLRPPAMFRETAAGRWLGIVARNTAEAKRRFR
ncbi:hypothetical protein [Tranquillimonas alkanivorans]|uniref:Phage protein, HK97 gp10 family n=1 Tax=Tranquillimonas alkanivorans TaxID=441119 RepID=A0A1I5PN40_9RHOB|nr:hypothetical protein [Tranquillimonas alkanivorans]SFP35307.1 hypothetical protein SAMN04488047_105173 [Tranquillimonas alkanivorans]